MRLLLMASAAVALHTGVVLAQAAAPPHAPDGGTFERIQSISILPVTNAPFRATVVTEWTKILADGTKQTIRNHRLVARDSSGRIFEERRMFSPDGDKQITFMQERDFEDPNRHEQYVCMTERKVCYLEPYRREAMKTSPQTQPASSPRTPLMADRQPSNVTQEDLGRRTIESLDALGSREVTTLPAGAFGNQVAEPVVKEFWYSPHLGINLVVKRFDPRSGAQNFDVENVSLSEPDPKLFAPPNDYRVVKTDEGRPGFPGMQ